MSTNRPQASGSRTSALAIAALVALLVLAARVALFRDHKVEQYDAVHLATCAVVASDASLEPARQAARSAMRSAPSNPYGLFLYQIVSHAAGDPDAMTGQTEAREAPLVEALVDGRLAEVREQVGDLVAAGAISATRAELWIRLVSSLEVALANGC